MFVKTWFSILKAHWVMLLAVLFLGMMFGAAIFSLPGRIYRSLKSGVGRAAENAAQT